MKCQAKYDGFHSVKCTNAPTMRIGKQRLCEYHHRLAEAVRLDAETAYKEWKASRVAAQIHQIVEKAVMR